MLKALEWIHENRNQILENAKELIRIPSISTDPASKQDVLNAANWIKANFERLGLESRLMETLGHPAVFAQTKVDPTKPTLLVYFHYDVQPAGAAELWSTPPFEPTEVEGRLYARGSNDNKLSGMMPVYAMEAFLQTGEELPVNLKFCIEGEEEQGSANIRKVIEDNQVLLACDYIVLSDGTHLAPDLPGIETGSRGLVYITFSVKTGEKDLHSGEFGGTVKNANFEMAKILASLKNEKGQIMIPHLYDEVLPPSEAELEAWKKVPLTEEIRKKDAGVAQMDKGEEGYSLIERNWSRPTLDINGMWGGYTEAGSKTVIPNLSHAKVSIRLVPGQDPETIYKRLCDYLKSFEKDGVTISIEPEHFAKPFLTESSDPAFSKLQEAFGEVYDKPALFIRSGGTIGLLTDFQEILNKPILFINGRSPDEDLHAPNEFMRLESFWKGIEVNVRFWGKLAGR